MSLENEEQSITLSTKIKTQTYTQNGRVGIKKIWRCRKKVWRYMKN